ncbi:hypothetical protein H0W26_00740 [Candidatus Dependentiae bacterium]|nr:hypothetical protein [Candidatus Dependentiae bacterium]
MNYCTRTSLVLIFACSMTMMTSVYPMESIYSSCSKHSNAQSEKLTVVSNNSTILKCFKELPIELRKFILFLALESSLNYNFICSKALKGHTDCIVSVAFSPDGTTVLTGSGDCTARLWDVKTGQQLHILKGHTGRLLDVKIGQQLYIVTGDEGNITSVAYSPDGTMALTGSVDGITRLWDAKTGKQLHVLEGDTNRVTSVAFSPDGNTILTGSANRIARLWICVEGSTNDWMDIRGATAYELFRRWYPIVSGYTLETNLEDDSGLSCCRRCCIL